MLRGICLFLAVCLALAAPSPLFAQDGESTGPDRFYHVEGLNSGLGPVPDHIDRTTPRAALESLLYAARIGDWQAAAHLLDLRDYPAERQPVLGPALARALETVIDRKAVIDWTLLPDRPDALDADAPTRIAAAGSPRKSILLWTFDLDDRRAAIRLNRIRPEGEAPVWVFPQQTVGNIPVLIEQFGPSWLERQMPDWLRTKWIFGLHLWEILAVPVLVALAAFAAWLVRWMLDKASARAERRVTTKLLRAIRGPAIFGALTIIVSIASSTLFVFSGQIDAFLQPAIWIGLLVSGIWLLVNAVDVVLDRLVSFESTDLTARQEARNRELATQVAAGRRALIVIMAVLGAGIFLTSTNIFQNLGLSLLGTAGALTLVLGFAAQRVLSNIMSSMQIALNQSARIGDRIVYKGYLCHVERIGFTYVQLRDWDNTRLMVPVEEFVTTEFENWTTKEPEMLRIIKIKCAHHADVEMLRTAFDEIIEELDKDELGDLDNVLVRVADQDVFGKDVWFCLPCADPNTSWDLACQAREALLARGSDIERERGEPVFPEANPAEAA